MEKVVRDGKVAVLYSPSFGAGWSTWNEDMEGLVFDHIIVNAVLAGDKDAALARAREILPGGYFGGIDDLCVKWVSIGAQFEITEYDGAESVEVLSEKSYFTA